MTDEYANVLGRYTNDITAGMWVKIWDGSWKQVAGQPGTDVVGWVTFRFTDGTSTAMPSGDVRLTRNA